jgi:predicted secreted protein
VPGARSGWSSVFDDLSRRTRTRPETTGETGDGVWAIYTVSADGDARVEEVYATELDALRANRNNTDASRKVRFLPYGIAVSVLDDSDEAP